MEDNLLRGAERGLFPRGGATFREGGNQFIGTTVNVFVEAGTNAIYTKPFSGSGSPENVLSARVGATYMRTNGTTGLTLYVKESGTDNRGWVAK